MKTKQWLYLLLATFAVFSTYSCQEWGEMDPPAGNQVYPKLEVKGEIKFESELSPDIVTLSSYPGGTNPTIVNDEFKGKVLQLAGGYARYNNPLANVKLQKGASLTMWFKTSEDNLSGAIFSFSNEDNSEHLFFTPNAWLKYQGPDGTYEVNNPASTQTGAFTPNEWHYLALSIQTDGYFIYIDGEKKYEEKVEGFDFSKIVDAFFSLPYFYVGYGSSTQPKTLWVDDIKVYRNVITQKEIKVPPVTGGSVGEPYQFPPRGTVGYYLLDGTFANSLNLSQGGELITVETQATVSGFAENDERGTVWNQQEGWTGHANGWAYTRFANPLKGKELENGVSVNMWINPPVINWWDQIFVLNDGTQKFWFNAIGYMGFHNGGDIWFDCNQNNNTNALAANTWTFVTINITPTGFAVYYNGELKFDTENNAQFAGTITDYSNVLNLFTSSDNFFLGYESWWKAAPAMVDDIFLVTRPLTEPEVKNLYADTKKMNGGVPSNPSYLPSLVGYYKLNNTFTNALNSGQGGEFITVETQATPSGFTTDALRGEVWNQQEGWTGHANGWGYTRFDNPLKGKTAANGVSVSMWLNPPVINWWDQIFVLNDGTQKFWFNSIGYTGFHNGGDIWFDCNQNTDVNALAANTWTLVTINIVPTGFEVYYNGQLKYDTENNAQFAGTITDYTKVIELFLSSNNFYLGYESWWKAAPALVDDIYLCASPLSAQQAAALYNATKK